GSRRLRREAAGDGGQLDPGSVGAKFVDHLPGGLRDQLHGLYRRGGVVGNREVQRWRGGCHQIGRQVLQIIVDLRVGVGETRVTIHGGVDCTHRAVGGGWAVAERADYHPRRGKQRRAGGSGFGAALVPLHLEEEIPRRGDTLDIDGGVVHAVAEGNALPGSRGVVNSGQRGEQRRIGDIPPGKGRAGGNIRQEDQAVIAFPRGQSGDQVRPHGGFQTGGATGRRRAAPSRRLVGPIGLHGARRVFVGDTVARGQEVRLEAVIASRQERARTEDVVAVIHERDLRHAAQAALPIGVTVGVEFAEVRGVLRGRGGVERGARLVGNRADRERRLEFARRAGRRLVFHDRRAGVHGGA